MSVLCIRSSISLDKTKSENCNMPMCQVTWEYSRRYSLPSPLLPNYTQRHDSTAQSLTFLNKLKLLIFTRCCEHSIQCL